MLREEMLVKAAKCALEAGNPVYFQFSTKSLEIVLSLSKVAQKV
jgi:hypothetical protein